MGAKRMASRRGFPPNLYMNPTGYYYYVSPLDRKKHGIGSDKAKAFSEARQANAAIAAMAPSSLVDKVMGVTKYTLKDWCVDYLPIWVKEKEPAEGTLKYTKRYLSTIAGCDFAHMELKTITTAHVAKFLDQLLEGGSPAVTRAVRVRLQDMFRLAETKGHIETGMNPVTATYKPEYEPNRSRLSYAQFLLVRAQAPVWFQQVMDLALVSAQRREDISGLTFSMVRDGYLFVDQGKTGAKVQMDLNITLKAAGLNIGECIRVCRNKVVSKFIVHHLRSEYKHRAGDQIALDILTSAFSNARDKVVPALVWDEGKTPATLHEIRSLSERMYYDEYGPEFTQSLLGHKNAKTTAEYHDLRGCGWNVVAAK
jgi:integrase